MISYNMEKLANFFVVMKEGVEETEKGILSDNTSGIVGFMYALYSI
jgi:hypothetical protein